MKSLILFIAVLLIAGSACSSYTCPTYAKADHQKIQKPASQDQEARF
ncbi:MAG: hypothetical protein OEX02_14190 [Cyclobacteriaceae bacterium]|nr:hypothetical protein [Cyclobacteriaceae bacterium]